jgi:hypothetical protein
VQTVTEAPRITDTPGLRPLEAACEEALDDYLATDLTDASALAAAALTLRDRADLLHRRLLALAPEAGRQPAA